MRIEKNIFLFNRSFTTTVHINWNNIIIILKSWIVLRQVMFTVYRYTRIRNTVGNKTSFLVVALFIERLKTFDPCLALNHGKHFTNIIIIKYEHYLRWWEGNYTTTLYSIRVELIGQWLSSINIMILGKCCSGGSIKERTEKL